MTRFELALTRPPTTLALQALPRTEEIAPATLKREFLEQLKTLRLRAGENLHKAQARYKKNYERVVVRENTELSVGEKACLRVEVTDVVWNHKLESLVQGLHRVMENCGTTQRLSIGDEVVRVSLDRVTRAPTRAQPRQHPRVQETLVDPADLPPTREKLPPTPPARVPRKARFALLEVSPHSTTQEYVVDRVVDAHMNDKGRVLCQVRWFCYNPSKDTWEYKVDIPIQFIRRYWRIKGLTTLNGEINLH
jgi:hypothetical protein